MKFKSSILISMCALLTINSASAQVPLVFDVENRAATGCNVTPGNTNTSNTYLPDPFALTTGGRVATFDDWTCRRNQIKGEIEQYEIGPKPPKPGTVTATYDKNTKVLTVKSTVNGQTLTITSTLSVPSGTGPFPVVIGMSNPTGSLSASLFTGVIQVPYNHDQVVSYGAGSGSISASDPYFKLYPGTNIGKYSAWSWGISRLIDGIELVKADLGADPKRIAVTGCSYAGKMALFGGAFDERVALTIAQESGGGGINAWRTSQAYTTRTGTNIEKIDNTNYSWFKASMKNLNPNTLPHDHHELIAMIAPRAFLALGNPTQVWLGDESGYKSAMAAAEVWKAMGVSDRFGFVFTPDHSHCSASNDQNTAVTAFVNRFLKNTTASTNIRTNPTKIGSQDLSLTSVINWTTPTITFEPSDPDVPVVTLTGPTGSLEAPASAQLTASVTDANNNVTKVEFFDGTTKLGEDATAPYTWALTNLTEGTYTFNAKATDATNKTATATLTIVVKGPPFKIQQTSIAPQIDGTIDDVWNVNATAAQLKNSIVGTVSNTSDLSGWFKAMWDNTNLYILANVTDQTLNNDSQNSYDDDAIEVYLDINNDKASTYGANDVQYSFGFNDGTVVGVLPTGRSTSGVTYKVVEKVGGLAGYIVEAKIPWSTVQGTPAIDQLLGIEFMINDDDNGTARDKKLAWTATTDNAWENPSVFGVGKLAKETVTGIDDETAAVKVQCFPNPFTSAFTIATKGAFVYQVMNQIGLVLESNQATDAVTLTNDFPKGVYLVKVTQNERSTVVKMVKE